MADTLIRAARRAASRRGAPPARRGCARPRSTYLLRFIVTAYLFFLVAWPVSLVVTNTFDDGFGVDPRCSSRTPTWSWRCS